MDALLVVVAIAGMFLLLIAPHEAGHFEDPNGFHRKAAWQQILILVAGPAANFLVAMVLFTGLGLSQLNDDPGKVARVVPHSPAAAAGFQAGDRLRSVEGQPITAPDQLRKIENAAPNAAIVVSGVHANGQAFTHIVTPQCAGPKQCQLGLSVIGLVTAGGAGAGGLACPGCAVGNAV